MTNDQADNLLRCYCISEGDSLDLNTLRTILIAAWTDGNEAGFAAGFDDAASLYGDLNRGIAG